MRDLRSSVSSEKNIYGKTLQSDSLVRGLVRRRSLRSFTRCASACSVLDFLTLGSSLSLRNMIRLSSSLSVVGMQRYGSSISIMDMLAIGSSLSLRTRCGDVAK